ncbi:MAG: STY4851/ECs_5259 family protein [Proteobacteria bacterium]|nr:STY4851/ECs_5259 family protein [Pseudomonadota bacterium]
MFIGIPQIYSSLSGKTKLVANQDILYRNSQGDTKWKRFNGEKINGEIELRILQDDSCIHSDKIVILPAEFNFSLRSSQTNDSGVIELKHTEGAVVVCDNKNWVEIESEPDRNMHKVNCSLDSAAPRRINLNLRWENNSQCQLSFPYPSIGGYFLFSDKPDALTDQIPINSLMHVTAIAVTYLSHEHFQLVGRIKADDISKETGRNLTFTEPLRRVADGVHELPLLHLFNSISELFSLSADLDAEVILEIFSMGKQLARLVVGQFEGALDYDQSIRKIELNEYRKDIRSLSRTDTNEIDLLSFIEDEANFIIEKQESENILSPPSWHIRYGGTSSFMPVLAVSKGRIQSIRPCIVYDPGFEPQINEGQHSLSTAWIENSRKERLRKIQLALENLTDAQETWQLLLDHIRVLRDVHPDCLDTCDRLIESPEVIIGALLRLGGDYINMFIGWQNYLPFRWWQLPISAWKNAYKYYRDGIKKYDEDIQKIVIEQKRGDIQHLATNIPQMKVLHSCIEHELFGIPYHGQLQEVSRQDPGHVLANLLHHMTRDLFRNKAEAEWPEGMPPYWWEQKIRDTGFTYDMPWIDDKGNHYRSSVLNSVITQAIFNNMAAYPDRETRVMICAMRSFAEQEWDELLYVAQALFYLSK